MSAEIARPVAQSSRYRKPELIFRIDKLITGDPLNDFALLPDETGIIAVYEDRSLRVSIRRERGQFWPSVCHYLTSPCSSLSYTEQSRKLFVGCDNGQVSEFTLAEDYNSIHMVREYLVHKGRVTACVYSQQQNWLVSCSRDKYLAWYCTETGRRCGSHLVSAPCTALQFDHASRYAFVSDQLGAISILRLAESSFELVNTLKGHTSSVYSLAWDPKRSQLYSCSADNAVIMWDIGGGEGKAYELQAHRGCVTSVAFAESSRECISGGSDGNIVFWCMSVPRQETPNWADSDTCTKCGAPFFWNFRKMWSERCVGVRQHHCRKCGAALCDACSQNRSSLPRMGFEYEVRMCNECHSSIGDDDRVPLASVFEAKHEIVRMLLCERRRWLLTLGRDGAVKVWDLSSCLQPLK